MVAMARSNLAQAGLAEKVNIYESNVNRMSFEENSYDVVVSTGSIHHWKNPARGLDEIHRVLKPGGSALIYDVVSDTPRSVLKQNRREFGS